MELFMKINHQASIYNFFFFDITSPSLLLVFTSSFFRRVASFLIKEHATKFQLDLG